MRGGPTTRPTKTAARPCAARRRIVHAQTDQILIATLPRLEFVASRSFKGRKHFLIATRRGVSFLAQAAVRSSDPVKISRRFLSISRARKMGFSSHSPLACPARPDGGRERMRRGARQSLFNRHAESAESSVSHSKQRTKHQFNRAQIRSPLPHAPNDRFPQLPQVGRAFAGNRSPRGRIMEFRLSAPGQIANFMAHPIPIHAWRNAEAHRPRRVDGARA